MAQRGKMLRDLANKKKSGSNESLDSSKKDFKTTSRQTLEVRKMSVNKMYSSLLKAGSKFTAPARYIIAPSIFYRGYSYLVLKLIQLRVPSLKLEHSSGRGNLSLKCGVMLKE